MRRLLYSERLRKSEFTFHFSQSNANYILTTSYALILKWMSFANSDIISNLAKWYLPLLGREAYNKKNIDAAIVSTKKFLSIFEDHLLNNTFLVTEKLTLADIFVASIVGRGYSLVSLLD